MRVGSHPGMRGAVGRARTGPVRFLTSGHAAGTVDSVDSIPGRQLGEQLRVCSTSVAGRTVVAVAGEVDHQTATRLDDVLLAAMASGARCVEVDFSRVSFCDCAGLNVLLGARSQDAGVRFLVAGPVAPAVERLLQLTDTAPLLLVATAA